MHIYSCTFLISLYLCVCCQVDYAAADAIVALHILKALVHRKTFKQDRRESAACLTTSEITNPSSIPLKSFSTSQLSSYDHIGVADISDCGELLDEWISERDTQLCVMSLCQGVVDLTYKQPRRNSSKQVCCVCVHVRVHIILFCVNVHASTGVNVPVLVCECAIFCLSLQNLERSPSDHAPSKRTSAYSVRRTRLYHNCQLLAPDGQLLSTVDKRKLEWYLQRGLGSKKLYLLTISVQCYTHYKQQH